jgi:nucleoside-triphosphatase THEP1
MVAIFSEALLLELSVRLLGKTIPGFIIGSILAMSWNLVQKIFNLIVFYGYNIVELYTNLMKYAQQQLNLQFDVVWAPLILLLTAYALLGIFTAFAGIKTGRRLVDPKVEVNASLQDKTIVNHQMRHNSGVQYSIFWLILNVLFLTSSLLLIGRLEFVLWLILSSAIIAAWAVRYKRALNQLVRPKLWIFFVLITMITAFVFTQVQPHSMPVFDAVLVGIEMNIRAILLIMGFTVLGTELYHPKIRKYLAKSYFKQLPPALELSLDSLPAMIATVPEFRNIVRNPVKIIHQLMTQAEYRINEIRSEHNPTLKTIILTGNIGAGKTTCIQHLVEELLRENIKVSGIYSKRIIETGKITGYDVVDIFSGKKQPFLRTSGSESQQRIGKFYIYSDGLKLGNKALNQNSFPHSEVIIIDEIGWLEIAGEGWHKSLQNVVQDFNKLLFLSVRKESIKEVIKEYKLKPELILEVSEINCAELIPFIIKKTKLNSQPW